MRRTIVLRTWHQSFPFSCGPAALGSLLEQLGWLPPTDPPAAELELWRESTAVACPGAHPLGLALAACRRGFAAQVTWSGPRPWLWRHIHQTHGFRSRPQYAQIEGVLARGCAVAGVRVRRSSRVIPRPGPGLLLTTAGEGAPEPDPHWVALLPVGPDLMVLDPLRWTAYRARRSLRTWWPASGFEGTRAWVSIGRAGAEAPPARPQSRLTSRLSAARASRERRR